MATRTMTVLDLFSGIGGFSYGLEMAGGFETVAFCEIDPFCREVLRKHWPEVPCFEDIKQLGADDIRQFGRIDLVCGGFPCQPFSVAGKQKGKEDNRYLWPELARVIGIARPDWLLLENVPNLRTLSADTVLSDLEKLGYTCWSGVVGAWSVGAPHKRDRVWIVGVSQSMCGRLSGCALQAGPGHQGQGTSGVAGSGVADAWRGGLRTDGRSSGRSGHADQRDEATLADANSTGLGELCRPVAIPAEQPAVKRGRYSWPAYRGQEQYDWEQPRVVYPDSAEWREQVARWGAESGTVAGRASESGAVEDASGTGRQERRREPLGNGEAGTKLVEPERPSGARGTDADRPPQPQMGGKFTRLSLLMDGYKSILELIGELKDGKTGALCSDEVLRVLRDIASKESIQRATRGPLTVQEQKILQSFVYGKGEREEESTLLRPIAQMPEIGSIEGVLRIMWLHDELATTSRGHESAQQLFRECADIVRELPREMALAARESYARLGNRITSSQRREALKALGNSVVPQVVCEIGKAIRMITERQTNER